MPSLRLTFVVAVLATALLPATGSASLTKYADPVNVAPDAPPLGQFAPDVAMADDGRFAVSYLETSADTSQTQVFVQRFNADLTKAGGRVPVGPVGTSNTPDANIAMAADGRFAVAYLVFPDVSSGRVEVQRFTADGTPVGSALLADAPGQVINMSTPPAVAMADDGRFAVAWVARSGADQILRLRVFDAAGAPLTGPVDVDGSAQSDAHPAIGMAPDGRFVLSWRDVLYPPNPGDPFPPGELPAQRFSASGAPDGGRFAVHTGAAGESFVSPSAGMADDGRFFVAFGGREEHPGAYETDVFGRRFGADGAPLAAHALVNDYTAYSQAYPDVALSAGADALVAYEGQVGTQQWSYLRHFGADGTADGNGEHIGTNPSGNLQQPHVATDGRGRTAFVWVVGQSGRGVDVLVQRWDYAAVADPPPAGGGGGGGGGGTPPPVAGTGPVVQTAPKAPKAPGLTDKQVLAQSVAFPPTTSCASRRNFGIRLRVPKGSDVTQATVKVNGRTVAVRKGARLRSTVDLRKLPKGTFKVTIALKLRDGRTVKGERRYKTCAKKARGGKPRV